MAALKNICAARECFSGSAAWASCQPGTTVIGMQVMEGHTCRLETYGLSEEGGSAGPKECG